MRSNPPLKRTTGKQLFNIGSVCVFVATACSEPPPCLNTGIEFEIVERLSESPSFAPAAGSTCTTELWPETGTFVIGPGFEAHRSAAACVPRQEAQVYVSPEAFSPVRSGSHPAADGHVALQQNLSIMIDGCDLPVSGGLYFDSEERETIEDLIDAADYSSIIFRLDINLEACGLGEGVCSALYAIEARIAN